MEDINVWHSAATLIQRHGIDASVHAAMKANSALEGRDHDRKDFWISVWQTITEKGTVQ